MLVDTGFLVAIGRRSDPLHAGAVRFAKAYGGNLLTTSPVIVETCHFLTPGARLALLQLVIGGRLRVAEVPVSAYPELARAMEKYADRDLDFADASLLWLAGESKEARILTVDVSDFSALRIKGTRRFELIDWY